MRTYHAAALLAAVLATGPAFGQIGPQLSYEQPLSPAAVRSVQDHLRLAGAYTGTVDGVWGTDSEAALQQFQGTHGLQVTGQLNQATAVMLNLDPADLLASSQPEASAPPAQGRPLTEIEIRNLQGRLRALGYYRGAIDGVWGPGMQDALQRFQQSTGIQVSGRLNPQTVTAMGLNPQDLSEPAR